MFCINYLLLFLFGLISIIPLVLTLNGNKLLAQHSSQSSSQLSDNISHKDHDNDKNWSCEQLDFCSDRLGFEAIRWLHHQLDDDMNGNVDIAESDEFLRDELQYENGYERQKAFHGNDKHITVDELWKSWKSSDVRNWTVEETIEWLCSSVELPQYVEVFQNNAIDGMALPRLAANTQFFSILGINNPIHKQKLALKAMDVVLFGAPKHHNYVKDVLLVFSLVIAIGGCWFAYVQHKYSQSHLKKMMRDMDSLQKAEEQLMDLQQFYQNVVEEKVNLEKKLKENESQIERSLSFTGLSDVSRVCELEEELNRTREALRRAENALSSRSWVPPQQLQNWLQLTHELEIKNYSAKKASAEMQLLSAKEGCDKLRKKRSTLLGAFRVAHGNSIDDVDNRILQAKASLSEVTKDLQERLQRWRQIESFCGFPIVHNPGLAYLESVLYGSSVNGHSAPPLGLSRAGSEGTIVDEEGMPLSTANPSDNPSDSSISISDSSTIANSEIATNGRGSVANFSIAGLPLRSTQDKSSVLSLNMMNGLSTPPPKQSSVITPSSIVNSSTYCSSIAPETTDDEFDEEDIVSESSNRTTFTLGNSSLRDKQKVNMSSMNSLSSKSGRNMNKSLSEDHDSSHKENDKDLNHICHSESCSELQSSNSSTGLTSMTSMNSNNSSAYQRSSSDSPNDKTPEDSKTPQIFSAKSFDDETGSTDSNSTKDFDNKSITGKTKRSFFGLRKRKNSKHS